MSDYDRAWWEQTFDERSAAFILAFGDTEPSNTVISFSWDFPRIPGACALEFPTIEKQSNPPRERRDDWLFVTQGLSQPFSKEEMAAKKQSGSSFSARGFEFGLLLKSHAKWASTLLYQLTTYITDPDGAPIKWGDRFPIHFYNTSKGLWVSPGIPDGTHEPAGEIRALLMWPYIHSASPICTSTGKFLIMVGTGITQDEWDAAKQTSTAHVLLLLCRAGIGQRTVPTRRSVLSDPRWAADWREIQSLSDKAVQAELDIGKTRWNLHPDD